MHVARFVQQSSAILSTADEGGALIGLADHSLGKSQFGTIAVHFFSEQHIH